MKHVLMKLCVVTTVIFYGFVPVSASSAENEIDLGLRYVSEENIAHERLFAEKTARLFTAMRYIGITGLIVLAGYNLYNLYAGAISRSAHVRLDVLERAMKEYKSKFDAQASGSHDVEARTWSDSMSSFTKSVFAGLPTSIASTLVSGATLGLFTSIVPVSEFFKSEPSFKWFLSYRTYFAQECNALVIYSEQRIAPEAFFAEVCCFVAQIEKILGYIDYQLSQIPRNSISSQVMRHRREQLVKMTNSFVKSLSEGEFEKVPKMVEMLSSFVHISLPAGLLP